jgi:hypothetical protein
MSFDHRKCAIPTIYCGNGNIPKRDYDSDSFYYKRGTPYECMQKGYGTGSAIERKKTLAGTSLQQIKYVGEIYEEKFKEHGIDNLNDLIGYAKKHSKTDFAIENLLKNVFTKSNNVLDKKAYNSTLLFLYNKDSVLRLPSCKVIDY